MSLRVAIDARPLDIDFLRSQGIGRYAGSLIPELATVAAGRGGELVLLRSAEEGSGPRAGESSVPAEVDVHPIRRPPVPSRFADFPEQVLMRGDLRRARADVAHFLSIYRAAIRPGVASVITVHDVIPLLWPREYLRTGFVHRMLYRAARRATRLIADSECSKRDAVRHLGVDPERVDVVYLAADPRFRPTDPGEVPAALGIEGPYVLYVGGLTNDDPRKNVGPLIDGFAAWSRARSRPEALVLSGRLGPAAEPLRARARSAGARIVFTDFVGDDRLPALYSGARCFVSASRYEGFGLPQLEALACGVPVACFEAGSLPEVVGPGGLLDRTDDTEALFGAVERLCDDSELRERLASAGREHAATFSWRRSAEQTWDSYERALPRRPPRTLASCASNG